MRRSACLAALPEPGVAHASCSVGTCVGMCLCLCVCVCVCVCWRRSGRNFPIINHGRARGLIQKLRQRLMAVVDDRQVRGARAAGGAHTSLWLWGGVKCVCVRECVTRDDAGLLRLMSMCAGTHACARQALRELMEGTPAEGDPNAMAINIAKVRALLVLCACVGSRGLSSRTRTSCILRSLVSL